MTGKRRRNPYDDPAIDSRVLRELLTDLATCSRDDHVHPLEIAERVARYRADLVAKSGDGWYPDRLRPRGCCRLPRWRERRRRDVGVGSVLVCVRCGGRWHLGRFGRWTELSG